MVEETRTSNTLFNFNLDRIGLDCVALRRGVVERKGQGAAGANWDSLLRHPGLEHVEEEPRGELAIGPGDPALRPDERPAPTSVDPRRGQLADRVPSTTLRRCGLPSRIIWTSTVSPGL